ncbi:MAG: threonine/serine exporter family protein [Lachnospiraceae bacterium]|nr:threonine/serine exporter family protein [Lachnospiraceae bacterium]
MVVQVIGAFLAVLGFSTVMEVPKKLLIHTSLIGAFGWFIYLMVYNQGNTTVVACFCSAMVISLLSHISARVLKAPVTVFLIGGILPLVPGAGMYRTAYSMIMETSQDVYRNLQETLMIAGAIAVAIFIMDSVFRLANRRKR